MPHLVSINPLCLVREARINSGAVTFAPEGNITQFIGRLAADDLTITNFSQRQSPHVDIDALSSDLLKPYVDRELISCIPLLARYVEFLSVKRPLAFDTKLLADAIYNSGAPGVSFLEIVRELATPTVREFLNSHLIDPSKVSTVYMQAHRFVEQKGKEHKNVMIVIEHDASVLAKIATYFSTVSGSGSGAVTLPVNLELQLWHQTGSGLAQYGESINGRGRSESGMVIDEIYATIFCAIYDTNESQKAATAAAQDDVETVLDWSESMKVASLIDMGVAIAIRHMTHASKDHAEAGILLLSPATSKPISSWDKLLIPNLTKVLQQRQAPPLPTATKPKLVLRPTPPPKPQVTRAADGKVVVTSTVSAATTPVPRPRRPVPKKRPSIIRRPPGSQLSAPLMPPPTRPPVPLASAKPPLIPDPSKKPIFKPSTLAASVEEILSTAQSRPLSTVYDDEYVDVDG